MGITFDFCTFWLHLQFTCTHSQEFSPSGHACHLPATACLHLGRHFLPRPDHLPPACHWMEQQTNRNRQMRALLLYFARTLRTARRCFTHTHARTHLLLVTFREEEGGDVLPFPTASFLPSYETSFCVTRQVMGEDRHGGLTCSAGTGWTSTWQHICSLPPPDPSLPPSLRWALCVRWSLALPLSAPPRAPPPRHLQACQ